MTLNQKKTFRSQKFTQSKAIRNSMNLIKIHNFGAIKIAKMVTVMLLERKN